MNKANQTKVINQERPPGVRSVGPLFNQTIPLFAVITVSILIIGILSQVSVASTAAQSKNHSQIAPLFTAEVRYWEPKIIVWSEDWNLDPNLVATIMQIESCGDPRAQSRAGAMGLFQVMPFHFNGNEDPYKPNINAQRGLAYLKHALDAGGGDPKLALAGYNAGITGAKRSEYNWPSETVRYVYWGSGIYSDAVNEKDHSQRLQEWLEAGGTSLCNQATDNLGIVP